MLIQTTSSLKLAGLLAVALLTLGLLTYNWFSMWDMMSTVVLLVVVVIVAGVTLAEGHGDEREVYHRLLASRAGFVAGLVILSLGTLVEVVVRHEPATWLVYALSGMTLGKVIGLIYSRLKH